MLSSTGYAGYRRPYHSALGSRQLLQGVCYPMPRWLCNRTHGAVAPAAAVTRVHHASQPVTCGLPTGSGKTTTLEGSRGRDTRGTAEGDGLVHLVIDELFELMHGKAVQVGEGGQWGCALRVLEGTWGVIWIGSRRLGAFEGVGSVPVGMVPHF